MVKENRNSEFIFKHDKQATIHTPNVQEEKGAAGEWTELAQCRNNVQFRTIISGQQAPVTLVIRSPYNTYIKEIKK